MWIFLLIADLYFLSVGIRSMYQVGIEPTNICMVVCFSIIGLVCVGNIYLDYRDWKRGRGRN